MRDSYAINIRDNDDVVDNRADREDIVTAHVPVFTWGVLGGGGCLAWLLCGASDTVCLSSCGAGACVCCFWYCCCYSQHNTIVPPLRQIGNAISDCKCPQRSSESLNVTLLAPPKAQYQATQLQAPTMQYQYNR